MEGKPREDFGALVGWTSSRMDGRLTLRMQCVDSPPPHARRDVRSHFYVMDDQQAIQLANHLFEIAGQSKPDRRGRGLFSRLFG